MTCTKGGKTRSAMLRRAGRNEDQEHEKMTISTKYENGVFKPFGEVRLI